MKGRFATCLTIMVMAIVMILSPGFDVYAESYDSETDVELAENIFPTSTRERVEQSKVVENKTEGVSPLVKRSLDRSRTVEQNTSNVSIQIIFCNFRE